MRCGYEMFMGPFDQAIAWSTESMMGPRRFLERVWKLSSALSGENHSRSSEAIPRPFDNSSLTSLLHETIKKVSEDIEAMKFNTAISALMVFSKALEEAPELGGEEYRTLLRLLAPFAPHLTEELWQQLGESGSIHQAAWPNFDPARLGTERKIVIQVNGVKRGEMALISAISDAELERQARALPALEKWLDGQATKKVVVVPGKLINFVV